MSSTKSIWDSKFFSDKKKQKPSNTPVEKELSDEIRALKEKDRQFTESKSTEFYICVVFSTEHDKELFLQNMHFKKGETFIDGYEFSEKIGIEPKRPSQRLKLLKPKK